MKTRWEVRFEAEGAFLQHDRHFRCRLKARDAKAAAEAREFDISVVLDREQKRTGQHETGRFLITAAGRPEDTEDLVCLLSNEIKERLCFPEGRITLHFGFLHAERLPETPEEEAEVGEGRHWARLTLQEVPRTERPEIGRFPALGLPTEHAPLLRQYNTAKSIGAPVERFLGFFKVLEKAYATRGGDLLDSLRQSDALFEIASGLHPSASPDTPSMTRDAFDRLLCTLVRLRDNCAHLRRKTGYSPGDPRIRTDVEPYLGLVEALARRCVEVHACGSSA